MNETTYMRTAAKAGAKTLLVNNLSKCVGAYAIYVLTLAFITFAMSFIEIVDLDGLRLVSDAYMRQAAINPETAALPDLLRFFYWENYLIVQGIILLAHALLAPLMQGLLELSMNLARGREASVSSVFLWYGEGRRFAKAVGAHVLMGLISAFWTFLLVIIPFAGLFVLAYFTMGNAIFAMLLLLLWFACIGLVFAASAKIHTYMFGQYFLAEDPKKRVTACFSESRKIFKLRGYELVIFSLSFLGWEMLAGMIDFLTVLIFGISLRVGMLFLQPYIHLSFAAYFLSRKQKFYYGTSTGAPGTTENTPESPAT